MFGIVLFSFIVYIMACRSSNLSTVMKNYNDGNDSINGKNSVLRISTIVKI